MHIKHMHEMIEKLAEYGKRMVEAGVGNGDVNLCDTEKIIEMIGELAEAEYHARIAKAMEKEEEDEKEEEKYMLRMLKEEHEDEYKRMREEYGDEEADRRFYDNWRHTDGRFARKGTGSYRPRSSGRRRGYEEPPYLHMPLDYRMDMEDYTAYPPEYWRDVDRHLGRMYYTDGGSMGGRTMGDGYSNRTGGGTNGGNSGMSNGDSANSVRGYSDGYSDGMRDGRNLQSRDKREGRSGRMRRGYMETKEMNKDNSPESKQKLMKDLEAYTKELTEDVVEMVENASPEERALLRQKLQVLTQKVG